MNDDRARRAELEALQSELRRLRTESLDEAIRHAREELEKERRRLATLRAEWMQLGPRVEHLRRRVLAHRSRDVAPAPVEGAAKVHTFRAPRESTQLHASVVTAGVVLLVMFGLMTLCLLLMVRH